MRMALMALVLLLFACKDKKPKLLSGDDVSVADVVQQAPRLSFPIIFNDSVLNARPNDSSLLNQTVFRTFIPDSVFRLFYPVTRNLKLYVLGKSTDADKGSYVFVKSVAGNKKAIHLLYFNAGNQYLGGMKLADAPAVKPGINRYCRIDSKYNISLVQERKTPTGELWTSETIYYMDASGKMVLAVTNSNQDLSDVIMGNPIDSLPRRHKHAGDYRTDKKNLVSIRDGATEKSFEFFIHFSKQGGDCIGELRGTGEWVSANKAVFRDNNSPCVLYFTFASGRVTIKEENGCGSFRDITCFFEGSYPKVKEPAKPRRKK